MVTTVPGPTVRDMERMQQGLDEANARIDHLHQVVTTTETERDRYRERAERRELAYVAVREIAALLDTTSDEQLRAAIAAVVANTPPPPVPATAAPVRADARPSPADLAGQPTREAAARAQAAAEQLPTVGRWPLNLLARR